jgi:dTDP-4-amino-4,6-dideoxygalactose transaminase
MSRETVPVSIPVFELKRQYAEIGREIDAAIGRVMARGNFILGEEVAAFEEEFARYLGVKYGVGVASGTEALYLALLAAGVGAGDEVITVPNTAVPTVAAISEAGAQPVFVDINPATYTMDMARLAGAVTPRTKAVIPVHLYGNVADMAPLLDVAQKHKLAVIEDACQAHGAEYRGKKAGAFGTMGAFSFYPTKNLGAYGDGGMVVTGDEALARRLKLLRMYGLADKEKYLHTIKGINSRLDEVQAAVLRVKLKHLDAWNRRRREIAALYNKLLAGLPLRLPVEPPYARQVYHLYVAGTARRDALRRYLEQHHIGSAVHYPLPVHRQPAYADLGLAEGSFPAAEKSAAEVVSLPMFPELKNEEIEIVAGTIAEFFAGK